MKKILQLFLNGDCTNYFFSSCLHFQKVSYVHIQLLNIQKLWEIVKEMGIPDHLTCLLRNLYTGQEASARTGHRTTYWFQAGKGVHQGCILSPAYLTYMQSTSCKMPGWMKHKVKSMFLGDINNLRYADDNTHSRKCRRIKEPLD